MASSSGLAVASEDLASEGFAIGAEPTDGAALWYKGAPPPLWHVSLPDAIATSFVHAAEVCYPETPLMVTDTACQRLVCRQSWLDAKRPDFARHASRCALW